MGGTPETYDLLGLFHWGGNSDLTTNPYTDIPDTADDRVFDLSLSSLGLDGETPYLAWEFWTGAFVGEISETLHYAVPSHAGRVIALRPKLGVPQFIGWNRHITMGAVLVHQAEYSADNRSFTFKADVAKPTPKAPFTYRVALYIPEGYTAGDVAFSGVAVTDTTNAMTGDNVLEIGFVPAATGELVITVGF